MFRVPLRGVPSPLKATSKQCEAIFHLFFLFVIKSFYFNHKLFFYDCNIKSLLTLLAEATKYCHVLVKAETSRSSKSWILHIVLTLIEDLLITRFRQIQFRFEAITTTTTTKQLKYSRFEWWQKTTWNTVSIKLNNFKLFVY